eukprot:6213165-Pleurochrysis_carterae.AAC.3
MGRAYFAASRNLGGSQQRAEHYVACGRRSDQALLQWRDAASRWALAGRNVGLHDFAQDPA